jgi:phage terminase small subunit
MAQTKRRRQTKHRGNAAGVVESRGRTGRKPTAAEKGGKAGDVARAKEKSKLIDKRDRPPTWLGAFYRAMFATVLLLLASLFLIKQSAKAIGLFPIVLIGYTLVSYYTDQWMFKRRQRKKVKAGGGRAAPR